VSVAGLGIEADKPFSKGKETSGIRVVVPEGARSNWLTSGDRAIVARFPTNYNALNSENRSCIIYNSAILVPEHLVRLLFAESENFLTPITKCGLPGKNLPGNASYWVADLAKTLARICASSRVSQT
jgi:hypothetical protein